MTEKVFEGFGIEIFRRDGKYFIRYEAGGSAPHLEDLEITEEEAARAQRSGKDVYDVILAHQLRDGY